MGRTLLFSTESQQPMFYCRMSSISFFSISLLVFIVIGNSFIPADGRSIVHYSRARRSPSNGTIISRGNSSPPRGLLWKQRRQQVVQMAKHAWDNYVRYAWGHNELKPISKMSHNEGIFGRARLGATIIDALSTLHVMGLKEEFKQGRDWVKTQFDVENITETLSVFEVNIRIVGGLLSSYSLSGDKIFMEQAENVVKKILPAFDTPSGIPNSLLNFNYQTSEPHGWIGNGDSILSEFGSLHLEFSYLSDVTGNSTYRNKVKKIRQTLAKLSKPQGLYPNYLNPMTGNWGQFHVSMGAMGDSFYEYLLKSWLQSGKQDEEAREMYISAVDAVLTHLMTRSTVSGLVYFVDLYHFLPEYKMDHLGCFSGGLLALGARNLNNSVSAKHLEVAREITETCHESYIRTNTSIGPDVFRFINSLEAVTTRNNEKHYLLRPEVVESYFYLWRITKDEKYRYWGWSVVEALEKHCRTPNGYSGIKDVYSEDPIKDDVQQTFFLSETLKYLYLLFSDDDVLPLDKWVFNTEGHPLPIKGANENYRLAL